MGPLDKKLQEAKSGVIKQHAQGDVNALSGVVDIVKKTTLTLPNRHLDPAKLPLNEQKHGLNYCGDTHDEENSDHYWGGSGRLDGSV